MILWWHWAVIGIGLAVLELLTPGGFFIVFFGLGAFVVAVLMAAGLVEALWLQCLSFSVLSVVSLLLFRNPLLRWMRQRGGDGRAVDTMVGEVAIATETLAAGGVGRAELRGSTWQARNVGDGPVTLGARCRVVHVDGLVIWVQPE